MMMNKQAINETRLHATVVAIAGRGVLLYGPPGCGKSSLALRLIDSSGCGIGEAVMDSVLVSDDQVILSVHDGSLTARPDPALAGLLEVRGLGVVEVTYRASCQLLLAVELDTKAALERVPDPATAKLQLSGIELPKLVLRSDDPASPAKLRAAVQVFSGHQVIVV